MESVVRTLIMLGVIELPDLGTSLASVARDASVAARAWLEANPAEPVRAAPELITPPWADRERLGAARWSSPDGLSRRHHVTEGPVQPGTDAALG